MVFSRLRKQLVYEVHRFISGNTTERVLDILLGNGRTAFRCWIPAFAGKTEFAQQYLDKGCTLKIDKGNFVLM